MQMHKSLLSCCSNWARSCAFVAWRVHGMTSDVGVAVGSCNVQISKKDFSCSSAAKHSGLVLGSVASHLVGVVILMTVIYCGLQVQSAACLYLIH